MRERYCHGIESDEKVFGAVESGRKIAKSGKIFSENEFLSPFN